MTEIRTPAGEAASEGFHRAVLGSLPEAVIVTASDGVITFVNPAVEALFGYAAADLIGRSIVILLPRQPERRLDPVKWLARWASEPDPEQSRFLDIIARRRDGLEMTVEVRVREGEVAAGRRYVITVRDNTARRREQIALRHENLRAARILMVAEDAIVSTDADQVIVFFNPAAERMFYYRADEVVGQPLSMLVPPPARMAHAEHMRRFSQSSQASRMMGERAPVLGRRRSGETFPVEATITRMSAAGELTFTAHLRDVTERNRAREALEESERRTRAVFDHAHSALALLTPQGAILEINRAGAALTAGDQPLTGALLWEAPWLGVAIDVGPSGAERLKAAVAAAASGQSARMSVQLSRDGRPAPIQIDLTPIGDAAGQVRYVLAEGRFGPDAA